MQEQNPPTTNTNDSVAQKGNLATQAHVSVTASTQPGVAPKVTTTVASAEDFVRKIGEKVQRSENILVALSRNPSVDEMAAAIGLTMFLDDFQKHTTAIYSGKTPDALEFLRPESTFESNTASLQDFIIALSKDKADHLRYKLEGDFVKVFITPYKTTITEKDLEFSRGDYNVDLVIALNVPTATDLDQALSEHGRIMHDATTVDITTGSPGRFGEIEWSDGTASSVSEMVANLIFGLQPEDATLSADIATALLTGIVAATERFSNDRTSATTLNLASKLMSLGADQQLISAHVMDNVPVSTKMTGGKLDLSSKPDKTNLAVDHSEDEERNLGTSTAQGATATSVAPAGPAMGNNMLNPAMQAGAQLGTQPGIQLGAQPGMQAAMQPEVQPIAQQGNQAEVQPATQPSVQPGMTAMPGIASEPMTGAGAMQPSRGFLNSTPGIDTTTILASPEPPKDYAQMMAEALAEATPNMDGPIGGSAVADEAYTVPNVEAPVELPPENAPTEVAQNLPTAEQLGGQPVQENVVLPPPPEPPAPAGAEMAGGVPILPEVQTEVEMPALPEPAPAPVDPQANPGAFRIPGM